jgi:hypothetical protein
MQAGRVGEKKQGEAAKGLPPTDLRKFAWISQKCMQLALYVFGAVVASQRSIAITRPPSLSNS